mmetsp:Transcript_82883/g.238188  ORF Transcript_82883/g.238188 Transcript_82883/m.238188 type:complete len:81 (+) Transcript_82883:499-741(+)
MRLPAVSLKLTRQRQLSPDTMALARCAKGLSEDTSSQSAPSCKVSMCAEYSGSAAGDKDLGRQTQEDQSPTSANIHFLNT